MIGEAEFEKNGHRMKQKVLLVSLALAVGVGLPLCGASDRYGLYQISNGKRMTLAEGVEEIRGKKVVVVGELHDAEEIHRAQLSIIKALHEAGSRVAVGLEMFQAHSQEALDKWVSGEMDKREFKEVYYKNWNFPWPLYSMIFEYARKEKIPLVGLNVPPEIARQVAMKGFQSLSEGQKEKLPPVTCRVDPEYMDFIRRAHEGQGHGRFNFVYFCEAQLLWNEAMANHAVKYLKRHPETVMVLLTGTGHARKRGIPAEIEKRSSLPYTIILPEVPGYLEPGKTNTEDGDYILLGVLR